MRIFCFIFILQVLVLLTQPCEELFPNLMEGRDAGAKVSRFDLPSTPEPATDECSPFCLCSCCNHPAANHTASFSITVKIERVFTPETALAEYTNPNLTGHNNSIWQPPKA